MIQGPQVRGSVDLFPSRHPTTVDGAAGIALLTHLEITPNQ